MLIGLDDLQETLQWVWADGRAATSREVSQLFNWGVPTSDIGKHVVFVNKNSRLNRGSSGLEFFYICEVEVVVEEEEEEEDVIGVDVGGSGAEVKVVVEEDDVIGFVVGGSGGDAAGGGPW